MPTVQTEVEGVYVAGLRRGVTATASDLRKRIESVDGTTVLSEGYVAVKFRATKGICGVVVDRVREIAVVEDDGLVYRPASRSARVRNGPEASWRTC
jgi:hypothetical protein